MCKEEILSSPENWEHSRNNDNDNDNDEALEELFEDVSAEEPLAETETVEPVKIGILNESSKKQQRR